LRILRGLRQSDFTPLPAKTIARIERGEVAKPHGPTLVRIAERLGVGAGEIESY
jgi:transcriptional regulator with XRE-family HTH domain